MESRNIEANGLEQIKEDLKDSLDSPVKSNDVSNYLPDLSTALNQAIQDLGVAVFIVKQSLSEKKQNDKMEKDDMFVEADLTQLTEPKDTSNIIQTTGINKINFTEQVAKKDKQVEAMIDAPLLPVSIEINRPLQTNSSTQTWALYKPVVSVTAKEAQTDPIFSQRSSDADDHFKLNSISYSQSQEIMEQMRLDHQQ